MKCCLFSFNNRVFNSVLNSAVICIFYKRLNAYVGAAVCIQLRGYGNAAAAFVFKIKMRMIYGYYINPSVKSAEKCKISGLRVDFL